MTTTDDSGRFVFTRLPAGNYSAPRAAKAGYVPVTYGEKRTGGIGTPITLAEGQRLTIALKMLRGAVITGVLMDQGGKPAIQTTVQATQVRVVNGERTAAPSIGEQQHARRMTAASIDYTAWHPATTSSLPRHASR